MELGESARDEGILAAREPPLLRFRQRIDVAPDRLDEEQLRYLREHRIRPGAPHCGLVSRELERALDPCRRTAFARIEMQHRRQSIDQRISLDPAIAEETADDARHRATAAMIDVSEIPRRRRLQDTMRVDRLQADVASHDMRIVPRKNDLIAGPDLHR